MKCHAGADKRADGTDQEGNAGGNHDVSKTDERGYYSSECKSQCSKKGRSHTCMGPLAVHGQSVGRGKGESQHGKQPDQQYFIDPETAAGTKGHAEEERSDDHADTSAVQGLFRVGKTGGCRCGNDDCQCIGSEINAERQGGQAIMLLHNERGRRDVGKQHSLSKTELEYVADIATVMDHCHKAVIDIAPAGVLTLRGRKGFPEIDAARQQDDANPEERPEDALPSQTAGHCTSCHRSGHGGNSIDGSDDGEHLGQFPAGIFISGNGTGNDDSARSGHSLHQAPAYELHDGFREQTSQRGKQEQQHRHNQRNAAAVFVTQRTEKKLSDSQSDHAGSQSQLHLRGSCLKKSGHRRQRRQIHIRHERTEGRKHSEEDQNKPL